MSSIDHYLDEGYQNEEDTTKDMYVTFEIDKEEYGIEIANIKEIIKIDRITKVPETPDYLEGIINLRGDIIPVINVRKRFMKAPRDFDELTCIVVIIYADYLIGLIVDTVKEVMEINESQISPPPSAKLTSYNQYIKNIGKSDGKVKLLLDLDKLLMQGYN